MHINDPRREAPMNTHTLPPVWWSAAWLRRQADAQLALGRHVAAERLEARAAELGEGAR